MPPCAVMEAPALAEEFHESMMLKPLGQKAGKKAVSGQTSVSSGILLIRKCATARLATIVSAATMVASEAAASRTTSKEAFIVCVWYGVRGAVLRWRCCYGVAATVWQVFDFGSKTTTTT